MSAAFVHLLILISAANSAPIILARLMGNTLAQPIDLGVTFIDGRPLLGKSKTWRGLLGALAVCALIAPLLGHSVMLGITTAALAMVGDTLSSFIKRRMGLVSSARALALDQIPESAIPAIALKSAFGLIWLEAGGLVVTFVVLDIIFSIIFFRLGIRKKPY